MQIWMQCVNATFQFLNYLELQFEVLSEALSLTNVTLLGDGGCEADEEGQSGKGLHPVERQG